MKSKATLNLLACLLVAMATTQPVSGATDISDADCQPALDDETCFQDAMGGPDAIDATCTTKIGSSQSTFSKACLYTDRSKRLPPPNIGNPIIPYGYQGQSQTAGKCLGFVEFTNPATALPGAVCAAAQAFAYGGSLGCDPNTLPPTITQATCAFAGLRGSGRAYGTEGDVNFKLTGGDDVGTVPTDLTCHIHVLQFGDWNGCFAGGIYGHGYVSQQSVVYANWCTGTAYARTESPAFLVITEDVGRACYFAI